MPMESTIRFTNNGDYNCKQLNIIGTDDISLVGIEAINSNSNVLVINGSVDIQMDTSNKDENFTLTIKNVFIRPVISGSSISNKYLSGLIGFGYPHNVCGFPFIINATTTPHDLVITKNNGTVVIKFDNIVIDSQSNIIGPIKDFKLVIEDEIKSTDTDYIEICIGDIEYNVS